MIRVDFKRDNLEFTLDIKSGEFLAIVGQSGSGKTTLLRVLAGLEEANGLIEVDGEIWLKNKSSLKVRKRNIGFLMQDYALFDNMTILNNLLFVNRDLNMANRLLNAVDMLEYKNRYPNSLSGGQKQRIALARAIIAKPKLLLLDEPLSALDIQMRLKLQDYILRLHNEFSLTTIMVSHDISEVYKMANRVVTLHNGKVENVENINSEQLFSRAKLLDKSIDSDKYQFTIEFNGKISTISVEEPIFKKYKLGDYVNLQWSIK